MNPTPASPRELDLLPLMQQDEDEFDRLLSWCEPLSPRVIVEIGVFHGGTLARFAERFPAARVIGIDPFPELSAVNLWRLFPNTQVVVGRSQEQKTRARVLELAGGPFDVVHIDGDHSDFACMEDWAWARVCTRRPAVVAFHDVNRRDDLVQAWKTFDSLEQDRNYETVRIGAGSLYGIGVVRL